MRLSRTVRGTLTIAVAAPLIAGLLLLPQAWLLADVIQRALVAGATTKSLLLSVAEIAGLITVRAVLVGCGESFGSRAAQAISRDLRDGLFRYMLRQRPAWTDARASGELSGAIVDQVASLNGFFARYLPSMALAAVLPIVFALVAIWVEPLVGILFLVTAPLIPVFMALVGWGAEAANKEHQLAFRRLSGFFADRLRGLVTLKLLGRAEDEARHLRAKGDELRTRTLGVLRIAFLSSAVLEFFAALGVAGVALYVGLTYLGFLHIHAEPLGLRAGLFCLLIAPEVYLPLRQFAAHYHDRAAAVVAIQSLEALFEGLPAIGPAAVSHEVDDASALLQDPMGVVSAALTVRVPDETRTVLESADFEAAPGAHVAILGTSGSGKSTFLETLASLREFGGRVELGGCGLAGIPETVLRRRVAMLGQRPRLFHGSIAENIRFGFPDASDTAVAEAARRACVSLFASRLERGLATIVGEGGLGLSGGEAHRVALARLYLRDPDLMLLDEPTAHLDRDTEAFVLDGLLDFAAGRTLIVATHASAVAARMDRVLRIERGRIFETPHRRKGLVRNPRKGAA